MSPADAKTLLKGMLGRQRRMITVADTRVCLVCTAVGEKHAFVHGKKIRLDDDFVINLEREMTP